MSADHVIYNIKTQSFVCQICETTESLALSKPFTSFCLRARAFMDEHKNCAARKRKNVRAR